MMNDSPELSVVVPVFNEEENLTGLVTCWRQVFKTLSVDYQFIFVNDGSKDGSLSKLGYLATNCRDIRIISHDNLGHGPTILKGYLSGIKSKWVFQIDGDNQYESRAFTDMWENRESYDFLLGRRIVKNATNARKLLSIISVLSVWCLCGKMIHDINTPYRLMRSSELATALQKIPSNSFAPNIMISLFFLKKNKRMLFAELGLEGNGEVKKSQMNSYFIKGAILSFLQIIQFRFRL